MLGNNLKKIQTIGPLSDQNCDFFFKKEYNLQNWHFTGIPYVARL